MADNTDKNNELTAMQAVVKTLETFYPVNSTGGRVIPLRVGLTLHQQGEGSIPYFTRGEERTTLTDEEYFKVYDEIFANRQIGRQMVMEAQVTISDWEKLNWLAPPKKIMGMDNTMIGLIGTAYKEKRRGGNSTLSTILISADGSWTTITCYTQNNPEEIKLAAEDIDKYIEVLKSEREAILPTKQSDGA